MIEPRREDFAAPTVDRPQSPQMMIRGVDLRAIKVVDGGPHVRLGRNEDGGYVVPEAALARCTALVSLGLAMEWSFEEAFARAKPNLPILGFDHSIGPKRAHRIARRSAFEALRFGLLGRRERAQRARDRLRSARDYFRVFTGDICHYAYRIDDRSEGQSKTFADVVALVPAQARDAMIVKIDIEGSEYRVLPDLLKFAPNIACLLVEFHDTDICASAFDAIVTALQQDFAITHIHANNIQPVAANGFPRTPEITFLNRRLMPAEAKPVTHLPIAGLDFPNDPTRPEIDLSLLCH